MSRLLNTSKRISLSNYLIGANIQWIRMKEKLYRAISEHIAKFPGHRKSGLAEKIRLRIMPKEPAHGRHGT